MDVVHTLAGKPPLDEPCRSAAQPSAIDPGDPMGFSVLARARAAPAERCGAPRAAGEFRAIALLVPLVPSANRFTSIAETQTGSAGPAMRSDSARRSVSCLSRPSVVERHGSSLGLPGCCFKAVPSRSQAWAVDVCATGGASHSQPVWLPLWLHGPRICGSAPIPRVVSDRWDAPGLNETLFRAPPRRLSRSSRIGLST